MGSALPRLLATWMHVAFVAQVMAPRHHIFGTYPQLYIACMIMLVLSLPLSSRNY
jgi:hypothetical protein